MNLEARLLRSTDDEHGGPAPRTVLRGLASRHGYTEEEFELAMAKLLESRRLKKYSDRRHSVYGHPGRRRKRR